MTDLKQLIKRMVEIDYQAKNNHLASALSALPIIANVYEKMDLQNDIFILSKGHACLALYVALEVNGYHPDLTKIHPDIDIQNGISTTTGSLGHGLPLAIGIALGKQLQHLPGKIYVLLGDGECQEGTTWESLLIQDKLQLDNLEIIIDNNQYQALTKTLYPAVDILDRNFPLTIYEITKGTGIKLFEKHPDWHVHELTEQEYKTIMEELK